MRRLLRKRVAKPAVRRLAWQRWYADDIENQPDLTRRQRDAIWSAADLDRLDAEEAKGFVDAVEEATKIYRLYRHNELGAPRPHKGRAALRSVAQDAGALFRQLHRLDGDAFRRLAEEASSLTPDLADWPLNEKSAERATNAKHQEWLGTYRILAIKKALRLLEEWATAAPSGITPRVRGPSDESLLRLVTMLAQFYGRYLLGAKFNRGSKRSKSGVPPAVDLVTVVARIVRPDLTAGSIDEVMRRVMERRRRQAVGK
jgi:hypothetical protein